MRPQLLDNPNIATLSAKIRELTGRLGFLRQAGLILKVSLSDHPDTRDAYRMGTNSFQFGKAIVNVAAATRVLF